MGVTYLGVIICLAFGKDEGHDLKHGITTSSQSSMSPFSLPSAPISLPSAPIMLPSTSSLSNSIYQQPLQGSLLGGSSSLGHYIGDGHPTISRLPSTPIYTPLPSVNMQPS